MAQGGGMRGGGAAPRGRPGSPETVPGDAHRKEDVRSSHNVRHIVIVVTNQLNF